MNRKSILIILILVIAVGSALGYRYYLIPQKEKTNLSEGGSKNKEKNTIWQSYRNEEEGFEIKHPFDWEKREKEMGRAVIFLSLKENESDKFQESVNVTTEDLSWRKEIPTLDKYVEENVNSLRDSISDFEMIDSGHIMLDNSPAYKALFTGTKKDGDYLKWLMIFTIYNEKSYLVTYIAEPDNFPRFEDLANEMINSFKLIKNKTS